jgi:alkanesulfonate monooxygenase SsuD/methylene tetrahydromethanopterin reductase-like flavin-dependent oxidoreductase (luciferase family)
MRLVVTMGIRQLPSHPRPLQDLYRDHLEEAVLAEELGFDNLWASEHHFAEDPWNPSPITFLAVRRSMNMFTKELMPTVKAW